jgi:hypothetical protein
MAGVHWLALVMLYSGMALTFVATVLYVRRGLAEIRAREPGDDRAPRPSSSA